MHQALQNPPPSSSGKSRDGAGTSATSRVFSVASDSRQADRVAAGAPLFDALLVDVGGTLLETAQPVPRVYAEFGRKHGVLVEEADIKAGFRRAFSTPWRRKLRYEGGGEEFWRYAVATAMGSDSEALFTDLYSHFSRGDAWRVAEGARECLVALRKAGVKLGVVSNFDSRLRPILGDLEVDHLFDAIIVSCEVLSEKPSPEIFEAAYEALSISDPSRAVLLGDDPVNDVEGAQRMGMAAWLWRRDVSSFSEVVERICGPAPASPQGLN